MNGELRYLHDEWWGIDIEDGPGVDEVADGASYVSEPVQIVLCAEVFEHTPDWRRIIDNSFRLLRPGGFLIATMAGPNRPKHSADGSGLRPGEYYENIRPQDLAGALDPFRHYSIDRIEDDLRCWARR